jgi:hypothetical protein
MGGGTRVTRVNYSKTVSENKSLNNKGKQESLNRESLPKKRVFISFHMDNESQIKLLRHQAKSDKFNLEFTDYSVKEPFNGNWKRKCEERIRQSSVVVCMIGHETYRRPAVLWELNKAYEMGKPVVGVRIHKDEKDPVPGPLRRNKAKIINWSLEEIQNALEK